MLSTLTNRRCKGLTLVLAMLLACSASASEAWYHLTSDGTLGAKDLLLAQSPTTTVEGYDAAGIQVTVETAGVALLPLKTKGGEYVVVTWPDAAPSGLDGAPALPVVREIFVAPPNAKVSLDFAVGSETSIDLAHEFGVPVMPRQAPIPKLPGAREAAPFTYDAAAYAADYEYGGEVATLVEVGVARGRRVFLLEVYPVSYNPVQEMLSLRTDIAIDIRFDGDIAMPAISPLHGLNDIALNPEVETLQRGSGNLLVVVADDFEAQFAPYITSKQGKGFDVMTYVATSSSGVTIKNYIQGLWGTEDAPDYILLVGDTEHIAGFTGGGDGSPYTDLPYTCMDGSSDWMPDIAIGRFPASNASELAAMMDKSTYYDNGQFADPDYLKRACFMASTDNYTISEGTHNWVIENHMVPNEIVCDKLYQVTYGADTQDVRDSINDGRIYAIYSGHGGEYSWADGPPFSQSDVRGLLNQNMYPIVMSFACVTGTYNLDECFVETWLVEDNKAALAMWGSSVNSYWTEDDVLEKRWFDAIYDEDDDVPMEFGPTFNDCRVRYIAEMGSDSTTRRYFEMYNLMGDPTLRYPGSCSDVGTVQLDRAAYMCDGAVATVMVSDCGLNLDDNAVEAHSIVITSVEEPAGETVLLTETSPNSAEFSGSIALNTTDAVGVLWIAPDSVLTATYNDADTGSGEPATVYAFAVVDCTAPNISNVQVTGIQPRAATVTFDADEVVRGTVYYGLSCGNYTGSASGGYSNPAAVALSGLTDNTTYFFMVIGEDQAGNEVTDDNGGMCYTFSTPDIPDFFAEDMSSTGGNDTEYLTMLFTPNGSYDHYVGCAETIDTLPTDPSGGSNVSLSDDDSVMVSLSGGQTVELYGVSYSSFYIGSNGYLTFGQSDTDYSETLEEHFAIPRVAALYDDLNPSTGGTVSWKQESDRVVVTYQNVPEYSETNSNTFQFELYFNGDIRISFLSIAAADGIAGLSAGDNMDPDYYPSDLSGMGNCGPRPPTAEDVQLTTPANAPASITLQGMDDGLPEPAALDFIIATLPANGTLGDPGAGIIDSVPYTLVGGGNEVIYTPDNWYMGPDMFQYYCNDGGVFPEGGDSNTAKVDITVESPAPTPIYEYNLDTDPGWTLDGQWGYGVPQGWGSHNGDPLAGHTGANVFGYNLLGDYSNNMGACLFLTTTAIDCTDLLDVELHFWRWLGVERAPFDTAIVEVSNDGANWVPVWSNPSGGSISESSWSERVYDISAVADEQPTLYVRWGVGPTDAGTTYPGWNLDDIAIWGIDTGTQLPGDLNGDCVVDLSDLQVLLANYGQAGGPSEGDLDSSGFVDLVDLQALLAVYGTSCN